jgi:hypothetical protein
VRSVNKKIYLAIYEILLLVMLLQDTLPCTLLTDLMICTPVNALEHLESKTPYSLLYKTEIGGIEAKVYDLT